MSKFHGLITQKHSWQDPVISTATAPAGGDSAGDRYLVIATATGAFASKENQIAMYDGVSAWIFAVPTEGFKVVNNDTNVTLKFDGSVWAAEPSEDTKVKADTSATAGFLDSQIETTQLEVDGTSHKLQIKASAIGEGELNNVDGGVDADSFVLPTGYTKGAGAVAAADSINAAIQKLDGNIGANTTAIGTINTLVDGKIYIGNGSDVATAVTMGGDATISNTGAVSLADTGVSAALLTNLVLDTNGTVAATDSLLAALGYINANQLDMTTLTGVAQGSVNMGEFAGTSAIDNSTLKAVLQSIGSAADAAASSNDSVNSLSDSNLTGATPADDSLFGWDAGTGDWIDLTAAAASDVTFAIDHTTNKVDLQIASASVVNADVSASAAIAHSKLAAMTSGYILVGSAGTVPTAVAMSGDVTILASGATAIGEGAVDNAMLAGSIANDKLATAYLYATGATEVGGVMSYAAGVTTFANDVDIVNKKFVVDTIATAGQAAEWQDSVIERLNLVTSEPASPSTNDRYINTATGDSSDTAQAVTTDYIYEWNGATWTETVPTSGTYISVDDEPTVIYLYTSSWTSKAFEATTASLGCEKSGVDVRLDILAAGGLTLTGNEVGIKIDSTSGTVIADCISLTSNGLGIKIDNSTITEDAISQLQLDTTLKSNYDAAYSLRGVYDSGLGMMVFDNQA